MTDINNLFFELIRFAIGTQESLSKQPSPEEWSALYDMAKKQSLVGVCFAGLQRLCDSESDNYCGMDEKQYMTWMGMAVIIQQRNAVVDEQCVALQKRLSVDGYRSSILKGQGIASLYNEQLRGLRQPGDIDIFVEGGMKKVLAYCTEMFGKVDWDYINAHAPFYKDIEVELHWRVCHASNLLINYKLQQFFNKCKSEIYGDRIDSLPSGVIVVPSLNFNCFYILLHAYNHMFSEGLGLRQLMDYYFVLFQYNNNIDECYVERLRYLFKRFGLWKFATGIMWIMQDVFGLDAKCLLCSPNKKEGEFLLCEIMQNGNFGHFDDRIHRLFSSKKLQAMYNRFQHNWHLASHYPKEFLWTPIWLLYHYFWKRHMIKELYKYF